MNRIKSLTLSLLAVLAGLLLDAVTASANPYVFDNVRITVITEGLVRMEYAVDGKFNDDRTMFAWNRDRLYDGCTIEKVDSIKYIIRTPKMEITYIADNYPFGIFNMNVAFDNAGKRTVWNTRKSAFPSENNLRGAVSTLDNVNGRCVLDEGIISRDGFYLVNDTGKDRIVDGWITGPSENHIQDYYLFVYGDDYKSALKSLGEISGYAPMSRKYMHGVWYCRFYKYTEDDFRQLAREYNENDFPLDVMAIDMDWHTMDAKIGSGHGGRKSWTGYTWNPKYFQNPEKLLAEFERDSIAVTMNDHPADGIRPHETVYPDFMKSLGMDPEKDRTPLFDASDRKYMEAFLDHALTPHNKIGNDFWWLDWQQNYIYPFVPGTHTKHTEWLNHLYFTHSMKDNNLRGNLYSRWGGLGTQRYPIQFSGDVYASWESLAFQVEMTASSGNAGCYFWAHDIGGHYNVSRDSELYVRWTQFGALSSTLRVHSAGPVDRRPWLWDDWAIDAMRKAYHLRSEIFPYIYTSVRQTHETMVPLTRAMYIDYPSLEKSYSSPGQYLLGDNLIVAPVTSVGNGPERTAKVKVWIPDGEKWYGYHDAKCYEGGQEYEVEADIDEIPLFVRGGAVLPMQPYTRRMGTSQIETLQCRIYPSYNSVQTVTMLYEDDGVTREYENGAFSKTYMTCHTEDGVMTVKISSAEGTYSGQPQSRNIVVELPGLSENASVKAPRKAKIERKDGITYISCSQKNIREEQVIKITNP